MNSVSRRAAIVFALAAAAVAGFGTSVRAQETVTIGSFVSTSGTGAPFGVDQLQAIELAARHINASGGIAGRKLVIQHKDAAYDKTQAQSVVQQFIGDKAVIGLIGPTSSAEAFAADPAAVAAHLPVLAPNNGAAGVPQIGTYVHRIGVPEELLLPAAAARAAEILKAKTAAILYAQDDPFATTGFRAFQQSLTASKIDVVEVIGFDSKAVDFTAQVERVKAKKPDVLFVAAKSSDGPVLLRAIRQSGMTVPVVGNLAFTSPALVAAAGDAVEGLIVAASWDPNDTSEMNAKFVADYKASYNRDPSPLSVTAYNCVYVVKEALEKSKDFTREGLQKGLLSMDSYHFLGVKIDLKKVGDGLTDASVETPVLFQYHGGKLVKL
jgi:branched-chain amino acid transport system substrate-binding protein